MPEFAIKDIKPNPFRNITNYPINRDKVDALRDSIRTTEFWENIVARRVDGKAEIAYGHHRLVALKEEFGPSEKVNLIIKPLKDAMMLKIMANENMEEWTHDFSVEMETIRAVVEAYGEGLIELGDLPDKTRGNTIRSAPSFVRGAEGDDPGSSPDHPYTAEMIASFLGWKEKDGSRGEKPQRRVYTALNALMLIEDGLLNESDFAGTSDEQAATVVAQAMKSYEEREAQARAAEREAKAAEDAAERREAEQRAKALRQEGRQAASKVGKGLARGFKKKEIGFRQGEKVARQIDPGRGKGNKQPANLSDVTERVADQISVLLGRDDIRTLKLKELMEFWAVDDMTDRARARVRAALERVKKNADEWLDRLDRAER